MLSLYIHIPFCHHKCIYCDFYSIAQKYDHRLYTKALVKEINNADKLYSYATNSNNPSSFAYKFPKEVKTVYFGGGTPSLLGLDCLEEILGNIRKNFIMSENMEITLEANPENITTDYALGLKSLGFNRISLGVQSFDDKDLKLINRSHNSLSAKQAIETLKQASFVNISIDLISNLPDTTLSSWQKNLETMSYYQIPHISCYSLTREEGTMLDILLKREKLQLLSEEEQLQQMDLTMDFLEEKGYLHYETSSFALPGFKSRHNNSYWQNQTYIGFGAGAHSFVENTRFWNENDVNQYVERIDKGDFSLKERRETLSLQDKYNEYVMLRSRLYDGLNPEYVKSEFPAFYSYFCKKIDKLIKDGYISSEYKLTRKGWHLQDSMILELALVK